MCPGWHESKQLPAFTSSDQSERRMCPPELHQLLENKHVWCADWCGFKKIRLKDQKRTKTHKVRNNLQHNDERKSRCILHFQTWYKRLWATSLTTTCRVHLTGRLSSHPHITSSTCIRSSFCWIFNPVTWWLQYNSKHLYVRKDYCNVSSSNNNLHLPQLTFILSLTLCYMHILLCLGLAVEANSTFSLCL